jgi:hypothetical protein
MLFPTLQLPLNGLPDEVGALLALVQNRVHAVKGALRKAGRDLLEIDLFSAHSRNIDDITNCYKPHFRGYHVFTSSPLLISSIYRKREPDMFINEATSRADLEATIVGDASLYASFDEARLLNSGYSDDELRAGITAWIEAGDECGAA